MAERPLRIPDPDRPWLDAFLEAHPEQRKRMQALRQRDREVRDYAELVIADIYGYFTASVPSRRGLRMTLRSFLRLLEGQTVAPGQRGPDDSAWTADVERKRTQVEAEEDLEQRAPHGYGRWLLTVVDALADELDDTRDALIVAERLERYGVQRARAQALREAAELVRAGASAEELDRFAADAEPVSHNVEELAAEFGIALEHEPEGDA